jgi:ribose transport system substrate-binding protein
MRPPVFLAAVFLAALTSLAARAADNEFTIAVIPKGTTHEFWKSIHAGAIKAGQELAEQGVKVKLLWKGPLKEDDRAGQIEVVENFIGQHVSGIVLAPLDAQALVAPVELAGRAKIPVVIIDSGLNTEHIVSFVATDNFKGGQKAGERLGELLGGKGKALMLRYQEGSASTEQREAGFLDVMKSKFPGIQLVSTDQHAGATRDTAYQAGQNVLNRFGRDLQGIFTPNESACAGMILAIRDMGKAGKVKHVGFDASKPLLDALNKGEVHGLVVQDPFKMGYMGVKTLVQRLRGEKVEKRVDTGVYLVTKENIADPQIKELINPPLEKYLK